MPNSPHKKRKPEVLSVSEKGRITSFFKSSPAVVPKNHNTTKCAGRDEATGAGDSEGEHEANDKSRRRQLAPTSAFHISTPDSLSSDRTSTSPPISTSLRADICAVDTVGYGHGGADLTPGEVKLAVSDRLAPSEDPPAAATSSFSTSSSTLSTLPRSSSSTTRRTVKNGEDIILNSDSESSDDELPDLDFLLPRKKRKITPPLASSAMKPSRPAVRLPNNAYKGRKAEQFVDDAKTSLLSLANMVKERQRKAQSEAKIAEMNAAIEASETQNEEAASESEPFDQQAAIVGATDDEEGAKRLKQALERTGISRNVAAFHFFTNARTCAPNDPFPVEKLPDETIARLLGDDQCRAHACLTGFVQELGSDCLPVEVMRWFAHQLVHEPNEELCEAYVAIILDSDPSHTGISSLKDFYTYGREPESSPDSDGQSPASSPPLRKPSSGHDDVVECDCFSKPAIGQLSTHHKHDRASCKSRSSDASAATQRQNARKKGRQKEVGQMVPSQKQKTKSTTALPGLLHVICVITHCAPSAGSDIASRTIADLALTTVDENVRRDGQLRLLIQQALDELVNTMPVDDMDNLFGDLRERFFEDEDVPAMTQCQLIMAFPATTPASHDIRRRLALYCITREGEDRPSSYLNWARSLLSRMSRGPEFHIGDSTDYDLLASLAYIMDIAIDAGFSQSNFAWLTSQTTPNPEHSLYFRPVAESSDEKAFNQQIDSLVNRILSVSSRIKGMGTSYLDRWDAREALEALSRRLEYVVRARPKKKKDTFGLNDDIASGEREVQGQRRFMDSFAKKRDDTTVAL